MQNFISLLHTILVWPLAFTVFVVIFREEIKKFINEVSEFDFGGRKVTRRNKQESIEQIDGKQTSKETGSERWDYKRLFLDLFLKDNSVSALRWFYEHPNKHTASDFGAGFVLPIQTGRDQTIEKDSILAALRETDLVDTVNNEYSISEKGKDYLKYKGLI